LSDELIDALLRAREAEKEQALFYRALAAAAEARGDAALAERVNELHADEQHHLSRMTARLLELGVALRDPALPAPAVSLDGWEEAAGARERGEVARYEGVLARGDADEATAALLSEILNTERHHAAELGGKWTIA
jgi:ferritin-like protein